MDSTTLEFFILKEKCQKGDYEDVKEFLDKNCDTFRKPFHKNRKSTWWIALLTTAVNAGQTRIVKFFVEKGANVNVEPCPGMESPLYYATQNGNTNMIKILLEAGAKQTKATDGVFVIQVASWKSHNENVQLLLKHGANVNSIDETNGSTALHLASSRGHYETVKILVDAGANVNQVDHRKFTALHYACQSGFIAIADLLIKAKANVNCQDSIGRTPLSCAVIMGQESCVKFLLRNCAKQISGHDGSPLTIACLGERTIARILIENGADVNECNDRGETPLIVASFRGDSETVKLLLGNGARINEFDKERKQTAIHHASFKGHTTIVKLLINANADINKQDNYGATALLHATNAGEDACVKLLLKGGAKQIPIKDGRSPLLIACSKGNIKIAKILIKHSEEGNDIVNTPDDDGLTPLHTASKLGHENIVTLLLENGADVNKVTKAGESALHLIGNNDVMARKLICLDASLIHRRSKLGETPLDIARKFGHSKVAIVMEKELLGKSEDKQQQTGGASAEDKQQAEGASANDKHQIADKQQAEGTSAIDEHEIADGASAKDKQQVEGASADGKQQQAAVGSADAKQQAELCDYKFDKNAHCRIPSLWLSALKSSMAKDEREVRSKAEKEKQKKVKAKKKAAKKKF